LCNVVTAAAARAPGKAILFGEHAVVYGEGAIAIALSLHFETRVKVVQAGETRVDGRPMDRKHHAYFAEAILQVWGDHGPLDVRTSSTIPSSSGLGSSAALTVSTVAALKQLRGRMSQEDVARAAFEIEYAVQGRASPTDTSTSAHGRAVYISKQPGDRHLWTIEKSGKRWCVHDLEFPPMEFVVGYTGKKGNTGELVEKVRKLQDAEPAARERIREIGALVEEARAALKGGDLSKVGSLMDRNQRLLASLGVSSPDLERLITAAAPHSLGAKLTGAGGGGCMIALTKEPEKCAAAIEKAGGKAYRAAIDATGVSAV
jgi:mevalonate kinase